MISYETLEHTNVHPGLDWTVCIAAYDNYGMQITGYSIFEHTPAHAHVFDIENNEIGMFLITDEAPKSSSDIIGINAEIPVEYKEKIVRWASANDRPFLKHFGDLTNWERMKMDWNDQVDEYTDYFKKYKASDYPNGIYTMTPDDMNSIKLVNKLKKKDKIWTYKGK